MKEIVILVELYTFPKIKFLRMNTQNYLFQLKIKEGSEVLYYPF